MVLTVPVGNLLPRRLSPQYANAGLTVWTAERPLSPILGGVPSVNAKATYPSGSEWASFTYAGRKWTGIVIPAGTSAASISGPVFKYALTHGGYVLAKPTAGSDIQILFFHVNGSLTSYSTGVGVIANFNPTTAVAESGTLGIITGSGGAGYLKIAVANVVDGQALSVAFGNNPRNGRFQVFVNGHLAYDTAASYTRTLASSTVFNVGNDGSGNRCLGPVALVTGIGVNNPVYPDLQELSERPQSLFAWPRVLLNIPTSAHARRRNRLALAMM